MTFYLKSFSESLNDDSLNKIMTSDATASASSKPKEIELENDKKQKRHINLGMGGFNLKLRSRSKVLMTGIIDCFFIIIIKNNDFLIES